LFSFETCCLFNNLVEPSRLTPRANFHLFRKGVKPAWEDPANAKGGAWNVEFLLRDGPEVLNQAWQYSVLAMIGGTFDDDDDVCGVVVSLRKNANRIGLWTKTAHNKDVCMRIGQQWKRLMEIPSIKLKYQAHELSLKGKGSYSTTIPSYEL